MVCADKIISVGELQLPFTLPIQSRPKGNQGTRDRSQYVDKLTAFDIETTRIVSIEQSIMYVWQYQWGDECTIVGRTWEEFKQLVDLLCSRLRPGQKIVTWVHNLSYEFQFLRGIFEFGPEDVFAIERRRVAKCTINGKIEMRCSYLHSNMSLDTYTSKMQVAHRKLSGEEFDYAKVRWPHTPLTDRELEYCVNDVRGLVEAIAVEMEHDHDSLYTIPMTSTGYVRRDVKRAMREAPHNMVLDCRPDYPVYKILREAFRGGDTHANRNFAGEIVHDVRSFDRSSSYPDVLCNCKFPVSKFEEMPCSTTELLDLIGTRGRAVVCRVAMSDIKLSREWWGCPYIPTAKCRNLCGAIVDNGRVLEAKYLEISLTDVDLQIILNEYTIAHLEPSIIYAAQYGKLPRALTDQVKEYYTRKTTLKGVAGQELLYTKSKAKLNSIYGMMAQDPVKQNILFKDGDFVEDTQAPEGLLRKYNKHPFLAYQWGCWCTAWARWRLHEGIELAGEGFVYADTDSVKFIGSADFTEYNRQRQRDSKASGAWATDPAGNTHYMGVFEEETPCLQFATLGAKKYCYITPDGQLHATIAGVSKRDGGPELLRAGGMAAFKPGFVFRDAGGTEAVYNDQPEVTSYTTEDGIQVPITANVVIRDSTYTLGISQEYANLIQYYLDYRPATGYT